MQQASSRAPGRATTPTDRPAEFHLAAGHADPADGCQACAGQLERQRHAATALRTHQRQTRQQVDAVIDSDPRDEATDLILEAETLGLYSGGFDDSPEGWGA
jgi:hypothetical protein